MSNAPAWERTTLLDAPASCLLPIYLKNLARPHQKMLELGIVIGGRCPPYLAVEPMNSGRMVFIATLPSLMPNDKVHLRRH
jgi:hypothetical protein